MQRMMNYPFLICVISFVSFWAAGQLGALLRRRRKTEDGPHEHNDYGIVVSATLTLLGLLIGFSFSMAINRYEQRTDYEEEEANAIGTEYLRVDLLPDPVRQRVQAQLVDYLELRISRHRVHASHDTTELVAKTSHLQNEMWREIEDAAALNPNPVMATVVTGMNDVINTQGYSNAARYNRIPFPAWALMASIAVFANFLIGFGTEKPRVFNLLIVPLAISVSFLLIADIDSPQGGLIRVAPQNLIVLDDSLKSK